ncbi:hypothetical protein AALO_G00109860 [Alosa alosa]|uniref:Uncharacterized protein n=1 Tax=Alosa alosa TaxID=278164 RepID=A0AAV6GSY6_9TELE|nr:hypothetical protein AALO_G00109860 [Alosa alosa]
MSRNFLSTNDELRKGDFLISNNQQYKAISFRKMATLSSMAGVQSGPQKLMVIKRHTALLCSKTATLSCTQRVTNLVGQLALIMRVKIVVAVYFCVMMVSWKLIGMERRSGLHIRSSAQDVREESECKCDNEYDALLSIDFK